MHEQTDHEYRDPLQVRAAKMAGLSLRVLLGLAMIAIALLGRHTDTDSPQLAVVGLLSFGAAYYFCRNWRAVLVTGLSSALLHADGFVFGMGAGLALGLWLWLAFYVCEGAVKSFTGSTAP